MVSKRQWIIIVTLLIAIIIATPLVAVASSDWARAVDLDSSPPSQEHSRVVSTPDRFEPLAKSLRMTPTGREALDMMARFDVVVYFEASHGSHFEPDFNRIVLDEAHGPVRAALAFVHEITHARFLHEGRRANYGTDGRQAYVAKKMTEEAAAVEKSIEFKMELEAAGVEEGTDFYPLEDTYRHAYERAMNTAAARFPYMDQDELAAIGREAGRDSVVEGLMNGEAMTSNTDESYPDYYGNLWDRKNSLS